MGEWLIFTAAMIVSGVGVLVFFTNPLLSLLLASAVLLVWYAGPRRSG